ncbi:MAG TPA: DeoR/GlpR family DNA-binding transcription regulator [Bryobacteraceae bacterium]|jgi:DeoR family transcriptional regulator of aga operon|nr:DeoR/GlpR family DNA-binding transcription regulator [Bryobacteraceae bacterium]HVW09254.1 DeoR/GlpR family DNA-binding transcription regulator [Bryobacteraceae bacterium]
MADNSNSSSTHARAEHILRELQTRGSVSIQDLVQTLGVSVATVRRDLQDLEGQALLRRVHGGAISIAPLFYEPFRHDSSFQEEIGRQAAEKRRIANAAAELIQDGDTIILTAGTTTTEIIRSMRQRRCVSVVTNAVNVAMELSKRKDINVIVTGGYLRGDWFSLVGPPAAHTISHLFPAIAFLGANGVDPDRGLTSNDPDEAEINSLMVRQARKKVAVADHTKLGVVASCLICPIESVDLLITDCDASPEAVKQFEACGIEVQCV